MIYLLIDLKQSMSCLRIVYLLFYEEASWNIYSLSTSLLKKKLVQQQPIRCILFDPRSRFAKDRIEC